MNYKKSSLLALTAATLGSFVGGAHAAPAGHDLTDQIIVQFENPNAAGDIKARGLSQQISKKLTFVRKTSLGAHVFKLPTKETLASIKGYATAIAAVSGVKRAEPDQMMFANEALPLPPSEGVTLDTNQPVYDLQWHYHESTGGMNLESAWQQMDSTDSVVNVAVIDTGITNHVDLVGNYVGGTDMIHDSYISRDGNGRDSDPSDPGDWTPQGYCGQGYPRQDENSSWHGTHVSGTISAVTNNNRGVAGIGYNLIKVVPVRALGQCGGYTSDIADGIVWAATGSNNPNKAKVINMSLGGSGSCSSTYQQAIDVAVTAGTTVVVSAGNANANAANYSPASCQNVITVAATGRTGAKAYYSNYGAVVDLAAPGGDMSTGGENGVLSTLNSGDIDPAQDTYAYYQGTSMAAPHVAAAAALLYSKNPALKPADIENILVTSARSFPATCNQCGSGILDAGAALSAATGTQPPSPPPEVTPPAAPTDFSITVGAGIADLSWSDQSADETGFYIEMRKQNRRKWSGYTAVTTTAENVEAYQDSGLDGTYEYRIRSFNSAGNSDWVTHPAVTVSAGSDGGSGGTCKGNSKKCN